jgi:hypothetical protein
MKLFTCTAHAVADKLPFLKQVLYMQQFLADEVHVYVMTNKTSQHDLEQIQAIFPPTTDRFNVEVINRDYQNLPSPWLLTWAHKPLMLEKFQDPSYTHFMYVEDDMEVTPMNFNYWIKSREILRPHGLYPSFIRVEWSDTRQDWALIDFIEGDKFSVSELPRVSYTDGLGFVNLPRPYQGMFLYDRELMLEHIQDKTFDLFQCRPDWESAILKTEWPMGLTEAAAFALTFTNVPTGCISRNFVPYFTKYRIIDPHCFVHHLPNKYINVEDKPQGKVFSAGFLKG